MATIATTFRTNHFKLHGEIRKVEELVNTFKTKDGEERESKAISLYIDDDDEERIILVDKNSDNVTNYKKGQVGTFRLTVELEQKFGFGNYEAKIYIVDFTPDKEK